MKEQRNSNTDVEMPNRNGAGVAGFVMTLVAIAFCWVPIFGYAIWFLGLIFSFFGMFKQPRGLAIAGFVLSCCNLVSMIIFFGALDVLLQ